MKIYDAKMDDLNYGTVAKEFSLLYRLVSETAAYYDKSSYTINKVQGTMFKSGVICMALIAKNVYMTFSIDRFIGIKIELSATIKITSASIHISNKIARPKSDRLIILKRMHLKLGKARVNYRGLRNIYI